jgi:hypothetical protein
MPAAKSVCVYCGSSNAADPAYLDLADRVGAEIARRGLRMVFGGGGVGLMGACARAARAGGADVLGVMPHFLTAFEAPFTDCDLRMVSSMHERKLMMFEESDAFLVLPGGIGTLEEAVEMLSWRRLGLHVKPTVFLSEDGFWEPFFHLINHIIGARLLPAEFRDGMRDARTITDAFAVL